MKIRNNSQSLQSMNSNSMYKILGRNEISRFCCSTGTVYSRLPSPSLSPSSFLQSSSFDVALRSSHWSDTCYLRTTPCSRIEESFSMEPRIMFTGRNDKECRPGSVYPLTTSPHPLEPRFVTFERRRTLWDAKVRTWRNIQSSITVSRYFCLFAIEYISL